MSDGPYDRVEQMDVYRLHYQLALDVAVATRSFGPDFRWLRNQMLRSSESVPSNMAEGFYSQYTTEYRQSLYRCRREAMDTLTHLNYAADTGQLSDDASSSLMQRYEEANRQLSLLIRAIERRIKSQGKSRPDRPDYLADPVEAYAVAPIPSHMEDSAKERH